MDRNSQSGAKLLITIVDRGKGDSISVFLNKKYSQISFMTMGEGTAGSELMDILGLDSSDKDIVISIAPGDTVRAMMDDLSGRRFIRNVGKGIAFSLRLTGIGSLLHSALENFDVENTRKGGESMDTSEKYSLIIAVSDPGNSDQIMELARQAGASGGTVLNARGIGGEHIGRFMGISIQDEKEIITILAATDLRMPIMRAINEGFGPRTEGKALLISVPVEDMIQVS